jgi:iron complex outermembrane receptor protein
MKFAALGRTALLAGVCASPFGAAWAQSAPDGERDTVFVLGRLQATAHDSAGESLGGSEIGAEEIRKFDLGSVDEAIDRVPGANMSNTGGSRNERLIYVRGFDRFQTTLSIDGVRVFLPADNRIDFGRFLTADLAEVQVSKGYVSVLDGPGGIGGAINLVTRKPSRPFEAELVATATGDRDAEFNSSTVSGLIGGRWDKFYIQASGATTDRDSWTLSKDFAVVNAALEDGGERGNSASKDWRYNIKAGWTPNDTDEYAISYIKQSGEKNAPYHVSDAASTRFWTWPYWDIESIYFLSTTQIGDGLTLKSRIYSNKFENLLSSFDSAAQTVQSLPRAFNSYYDDEAWGANVTLDWKVSDANSLSGAVLYRKDQHNEYQDGFVRVPPAPINPSANRPYHEPWQPTEEDTWSIALEDTQKLTSNIDLVVGVSYDFTDLIEATDANVVVTGTTIANSVISFLPVSYPKRNMNALNGQAALAWRVSDSATLHASVSSRTRFPTLFERFSSRMGTAIPNPDVDPERALNLELGGKFEFANSAHLEGALFYSDLDNALIQIPVLVTIPSTPPTTTQVNQTKNAASGYYYGAELAGSAMLTDTIEVGGNVTLIRRKLTDPTNIAFQPQGVPDSKLFLYADWQVLPNLAITPSLDFAADRWTVTSSASISPARYYKTGAYGLINLAADWSVNDHVSLLAGAKNITDRNYVLVDGFPEEGRNFYVSLRLKN